MSEGIAKPPKSLEVTWDGDSVRAEFRPHVESAWSWWAVAMETLLIWSAVGGFIALPSALFAIYLKVDPAPVGTFVLAAWPLIAAVWVPWQLHVRHARVVIAIGATELTIRKPLRPTIRIALEDVKGVDTGGAGRILRLDMKDRRRLSLPLGGASTEEVRWLGHAIEYATHKNATFWREEFKRADGDREALQRLLKARGTERS